MLIHSKKMTIVKVNLPAEKDINKELQWLGNSLGLFSLRDKDKSCFRVFIELLKAAKQRQPLSSDEIAERIGISRGTVIFHINKLMDSGLVIHYKDRYMLRVENLKHLIEELEQDIRNIYHDLKETAADIDRLMGL